jgi:hypothetical protein
MTERNKSQDKKAEKTSIASSEDATVGSNKKASKHGPIRTKIEALSEKIESEGPKGKTGKALQKRAVALILKNAGSPEWEDYMELFGFSQSELKKLMPDKKKDKKNVALAYLVGNGPCGGASTDVPTTGEPYGLMFGVTDDLDKA